MFLALLYLTLRLFSALILTIPSYVTKENTTWGEVQQQTFKVEAKSDFSNIAFLMERGDWQKNTVTRFRVDPGTKAGIIAEIDYISLESPITAVDGKGKLSVAWSALKR